MPGEPTLKRKRTGSRSDLKRLRTEQTNIASSDLDLKSALEIARTINAQDAKVATAVKRAEQGDSQARDRVEP